jgi:hypothetical protein
MKTGKLFLLIVLTGCLGLTVWQFNNLKIIAHEYFSLHRSFYYDKEYKFRAKTPVIKEKVAATDPEAAAVANYIIMPWSRGEYEPLELLAQNVVKFPENQYFLYELAMCVSCQLEEGLDPNILVKISNRLIELDPKNSNYYYLKAEALLHTRAGNNFDEVTEAVKQAVNCEYFKDPYSVYRDRALALVQKQGLQHILGDWLMYEETGGRFAPHIYRDLLGYYNLLITEKNFAKAQEISDTLIAMATAEQNLLRWNTQLGSLPPHGIGLGFGLWNLPQEIALQRMDLTSAEADKKRMELCKIVSPQKTEKVLYRQNVAKEANRDYGIAAIPFIFIAKWLFVIICAACIFAIISLIRGDNLKIKISKISIFLFILYGVIYFAAGQVLLVYEIVDGPLGCWHFDSNVSEMFLMPPLLSKVTWSDAKDLFEFLPFCLFVLPLFIVFVLGVLKFFVDKADNLTSRIISGILISMPLGLATFFLSGHRYIGFVPIIIFILFAFKYSFRKLYFKNIFKAIFCNAQTDSLLRTNFLKLAAILIVLCWIGVVCLSAPVKKALEREDKDVKVSVYSFINAPEKNYQEILKKIEDPNLQHWDVLRCVPLLQSKDLPAFMDELKKRKFPVYDVPPMGFPGQNIKPRKYENLDDMPMTLLLRAVGRDQLPVVLKYLKNPDNEMALVFRAQLGDKSVKNKLEDILQKMAADQNQPEIEQRCDYNKMNPRESQVVFALASISDSNEAFKIISEFYKRRASREYLHFYAENICTLPKEVVLKLQNIYLADLKSSSEYTPLSIVIGQSQDLYLDNEIAGKILDLLLTRGVSIGWPKDLFDKHIESYGIEHYLDLNNSELLLKGLENKNESLRAWSLCQLGKIHYQFSGEQLQKLAADPSWKVRANLAIINKSLIQDNDPSAFVRLLKSL